MSGNRNNKTKLPKTNSLLQSSELVSLKKLVTTNQEEIVNNKTQLEGIQNQVVELQNKLETLIKTLENVKADSLKKQTELNNKIKTIKSDIEKTISFQLGYTLLHSTKSWRNLINLPIDLWHLRDLAKVRSSQKKLKSTNRFKSTPVKVNSLLKKQYGLKFISILDEISHTSFDSEFKLFQLIKDGFENQIKNSTSLAFFIESCWKGNFGVWEYAFTSPNLQHQNAQKLLKALACCKERNLPIVFWNKEDPMHYEKFLPISSKCDVIFTTDSNKIADYQRDVPNAKVETLLFAANVYLCNPSNRYKYEQENICFAGSYYGFGHDDRKKQMDALLPTIIKFKGAIYDRMSQLNNERYAYPKKFQRFIRPAVPFTEIINVYKQFKIFLNVNTITDSPTMMSRRVYELLACGTVVISTPSLAIDEQFKGIVQVAENAREANAIAKRLLNNEWEYLRLSHLGYREVMLKHTYTHRAIQIANALGQNITLSTPLVSIVMPSNRPHFIDRIVKNLTEQVYSNMEVIVITQNYTDEQRQTLETRLVNSNKFISVQIVANDSTDTLGERLNQAITLSKGDFVAKMDDDDFYFPNYLQDMLIPFKFGNYDVVGKKELFIYLEDKNITVARYKGFRHKEEGFLAGSTLVFSRKALDKLKFKATNTGEDSDILNQAKDMKMKTYATDPFNHILYRSKNVNQHTWQVESNFFAEKGETIGVGLAESITVI